MSISYPLTLPNSHFAKITVTPINVVGGNASPFTLQQTAYKHQGQAWQAQIDLPPIITRALAAPWVAAILSLNGRYGTFLLGDPTGKTPQGTWGGTPVVDGTSQTGQSLAIRGLTPNITGIGKAGDYLQIGTGTASRLYCLMQDLDSDGSGDATADIWPRLRESPADGATIITSNTVGLFRLTTNQLPWVISPGNQYEFQPIQAIEAI